MSLSDGIKQKALELGFCLVGITDASPIDPQQAELLTDWLKSGCAGRMDYMHRTFDKRIDPAKLLEGAKSVVCVALNYTPPKTKQSVPSSTALGKVANYAQYEDYHLFIKRQLHKLADSISPAAAPEFKYKVCVGSAPAAEKSLAARAGLGFIGKNHLLTNPELGPQILLGEIITNLVLQTDEPIKDSCANCNKCTAACPTGALRDDGQFDARRCISYLTIEDRGPIPPDLAAKIGNRLFGCDECLLACPYSKGGPPTHKNKQFKFYSNRARLNLNDILNMTEDKFAAEFADSPIKRLGLAGLKRNARICLENITENPD